MNKEQYLKIWYSTFKWKWKQAKDIRHPDKLYNDHLDYIGVIEGIKDSNECYVMDSWMK